MSRRHIAGITLALTGLTTGAVAVGTGMAHSDDTPQPAYLKVVPGEVTKTPGREAVGVRRPDIEAKARKAAIAREAALALAARQAAARKAAAARASRSSARAALSTGDPRAIAQSMLSGFGWSSDQFSCLDSLWMRESGWRVTASNPSGAYGIPQALPGSKMASAGSDWQTNARTQIAWGFGYIKGRYGTPCGAWGHSQSYGWY
ncbi:MAG: hypothetical protein WCB04_11765 [Mycobacteriales bacterium]